MPPPPKTHTLVIYNGSVPNRTTYVFDKGYCRYDWWISIDQAGACFVTRMNSWNASKGKPKEMGTVKIAAQRRYPVL